MIREKSFLHNNYQMDMVRGLAISAVVIHHWLLFISHQSSSNLTYNLTETIQDVMGTAVHLFFILSGWGITLSYLKKEHFSWSAWVKRRFRKIILPYWLIVILTFLLINMGHRLFPKFLESNYSWLSLISYLTFTRNFYSPGWDMNPTLWFMPVIVLLYAVFPVLIRTLERYGIVALLIISAVITYGSITLCVLAGYPVTHQSALFLFYVIEFSFGILIGYTYHYNANLLDQLSNFKMFCLGIGFYTISFLMIKFWKLGSLYNDLFTALGVFLLTIYFCQWLYRFSKDSMIKILTSISKESYLMYLIHGPLILFLIMPLLMRVPSYPLNSLTMILLSVVYCVFIFILALIISESIKLT
ncbi:MAG: acyltransferase, partial [Sedimentisphaerales bacterium]|nr:acyltransferase [Sedimentisphaerales bacterium]